MPERTSRQIHDSLEHSVIDVDGHYVEFGPDILDYLRRVAGQRSPMLSRRPATAWEIRFG